MSITFNCKNMTNLSTIMITACREILCKFYSLQITSYLWCNKCVFAIKKKTDSYKAVSSPMDALNSHDNCTTTPSIIICGVYIDYLLYLEWLKFDYILALIKEQNHGVVDKTTEQNTIPTTIHVYDFKILINHLLFGYSSRHGKSIINWLH
eukprot:375820_1